MKVMATFDRSSFSEAILPLLSRLAAFPEAEFLLFSVSDGPQGRRESEAITPAHAVGLAGQASQPLIVEQREPAIVENKEQAVERRLADIRDYLEGIGGKLPPGTKFVTAGEINAHAADAIIATAEKERPDVIVMATHGRTGLSHVLVGNVAEKVVRAGVAPVLLVRPEDVKHQRNTGR
ncbi:MAG TPA: universal stress protein [Dehalococcoidia bacterium]|nr:universal stress protein [Dehalococcoidia bacterium]